VHCATVFTGFFPINNTICFAYQRKYATTRSRYGQFSLRPRAIAPLRSGCFSQNSNSMLRLSTQRRQDAKSLWTIFLASPRHCALAFRLFYSEFHPVLFLLMPGNKKRSPLLQAPFFRIDLISKIVNDANQRIAG
jgi:hypothetical protein